MRRRGRRLAARRRRVRAVGGRRARRCAHLVAGVERRRLVGDRRAQVAQRPVRLRHRVLRAPRVAPRRDDRARRYLIQDDGERGVRDQVDWVPEFSRRARGVRRSTRRCARSGGSGSSSSSSAAASRRAASPSGIAAQPGRRGAERRRAQPGAAPLRDDDADRRGPRARPARRPDLAERDEWDGRKAIRVSVSNWQTGDDEIDLAVESFAAARFQRV